MMLAPSDLTPLHQPRRENWGRTKREAFRCWWAAVGGSQFSLSHSESTTKKQIKELQPEDPSEQKRYIGNVTHVTHFSSFAIFFQFSHHDPDIKKNHFTFRRMHLSTEAIESP